MVLLKDRASKKSASFDELNFNYLLAFRDARRCEISKTQVGQKTLKDRWGNRSKKRGKMGAHGRERMKKALKFDDFSERMAILRMISARNTKGNRLKRSEVLENIGFLIIGPN